MVQINGGPAVATLLVFELGARRQSILIINPSPEARQAFEPQIASFLNGLSLASGAGTPRPAPSPASPFADAAASGKIDRGSFQGGGLAGVWMGFKNMAVFGSYEPQARWVVFYTDGQSFEDLPDNGLEHFDRTASKSDARRAPYWGSYTLSGRQGAITKPGVRFPTKIEVESDQKIKLDTDIFLLCRNPKGVRLEGAWTSYGDPHDPSLRNLPAGKQPVIAFDRGGRFADGGIFAALLKSSYGADDPRDAAGKGTYAFGDFTLVLRYEDGRVREIGFSGMPGADPAVANDIVFIGRARFNKIK